MSKRFVKTKIVFLIFGVMLFFWDSVFSLSGNVVGYSNIFDFTRFLGLILAIVSLVLMLKKDALEAIVVPTGPLNVELQRAEEGARRFHRDESRYVIISGEYQNGRRKGSQPERIYNILRERGVPDDKIIFEHESKDTMENVLYTCDIIEERGIKKVIVVTDRSHAKRFGMLFERAKNKGLIPKSLRVRFDTKNIEDSYSPYKAELSYFKDKYRPLKK